LDLYDFTEEGEFSYSKIAEVHCDESSILWEEEISIGIIRFFMLMALVGSFIGLRVFFVMSFPSIHFV